ncbi:hypothetical protein VTI74DRAFT_6812 [Chaetomium olivicolor]
MALLDGGIIKQLHASSKAEVQAIDFATRHDRKDLPWYLGMEGSGRTVYCSPASMDDEPKIPSPHIFESLMSPPAKSEGEREDDNARSIVIPSIAECAVHLELLEVFFRLRAEILKSKALDKVFGVEMDHPIVYQRQYGMRQRQPVKLKDPNWSEKRRKKWSYFLTLAVARFEIWAKKAAKSAFGGNGPHAELELIDLPPLPPLGK